MSIDVLRPMRKDAQGQPAIGAKALNLGARSCDVELDSAGQVLPTSGVSIATSMQGVRDLPYFLLPFKRHKHPVQLDPNRDWIHLFRYRQAAYEPFQLDSKICEGLAVIAKPEPERGCITPAEAMPMSRYASLVEATQAQWHEINWQTAVQAIAAMPDD